MEWEDEHIEEETMYWSKKKTIQFIKDTGINAIGNTDQEFMEFVCTLTDIIENIMNIKNEEWGGRDPPFYLNINSHWANQQSSDE